MLPTGQRFLVAGQKSGKVFTHDPDRQGAPVWTAMLVDKLGEAEILFGGAADEQTGVLRVGQRRPDGSGYRDGQTEVVYGRDVDGEHGAG